MIKPIFISAGNVHSHLTLTNKFKNADISKVNIISTYKCHPPATESMHHSPFWVWDRVHGPTFPFWISKHDLCFIVGEMFRGKLVWDFLQNEPVYKYEPVQKKTIQNKYTSKCVYRSTKLTNVYEPLILNFFIIFTKFGKQEVKDRAAFSSSSVNLILNPAFDPSSSSTPFFLRLAVSSLWFRKTKS